MKLLTATLLLSYSALAQLGRTGLPSAANPLARDPKAVAAGEQRFQQLCSSCHGRGGEGGQGEGQGPNLVNSWELRRASDQDLFGYIHNGVKGTAMPPIALPEPQIRELAAYVRSLNAPANSVPVSGDPKAGEAIFYGAGGCSACHMIRGRGGYLGPDLTDAGSAHRLGELREAILNPDRLSIDGYQPVLLREAGGKALRGIVKHESNWAMEILDENGGVHLLHGAAMRQAAVQSKPWMPNDYARRLAPAEIQDLLAFLSRQSIRPPGQVTARPNERVESVN
jgi:putative heme-binding domain-containing protein